MLGGSCRVTTPPLTPGVSSKPSRYSNHPPLKVAMNDFDSDWRKCVFGDCFGDCAICHIVLFGANSANTAWQFFWAPQHIIVFLNILEGSQPTIAIAIPDSKPSQTH